MDGPGASSTGGGRFATFPVKGRPLLDPGPLRLHAQESTASSSPTLDARPGDLGLSFSASIAEALGGKTGAGMEGDVVSAPAPAPGTYLGGGPGGAGPPLPSRPRMALGDDAASNDAVAPNNPFANVDSTTAAIPPGAAPPDPNKKWISEDPNALSASTAAHRRTLSDNDDALLAYMTSAMIEVDDSEAADADENVSHSGDVPAGTGSRLATDTNTDEEKRASRHVRFGQVEDVDEVLERRASEESRKKALEDSENSPGAFHSCL